jgi:hypothetical protein
VWDGLFYDVDDTPGGLAVCSERGLPGRRMVCWTKSRGLGVKCRLDSRAMDVFAKPCRGKHNTIHIRCSVD